MDVMTPKAAFLKAAFLRHFAMLRIIYIIYLLLLSTSRIDSKTPSRFCGSFLGSHVYLTLDRINRYHRTRHLPSPKNLTILGSSVLAVRKYRPTQYFYGMLSVLFIMASHNQECPVCKKKISEHSKLQYKICEMITIKQFANVSPGYDVQFRPFFED